MKRKIKNAVATATAAPVIPLDAVAQIDALSKSLGYAPALPRAEQRKLFARGRAVPADVIEMLAKLSEQHGGVVAGMPFDAKAAREALAKASDAQAIAKASRRLSKRAVSDSVRRNALVGDRAMAALQALARTVRTPEGEAFAESYAQMRASLRARSRHKRAGKKAADNAAAPTAKAKPSDRSAKPATNGVNGAASAAQAS